MFAGVRMARVSGGGLAVSLLYAFLLDLRAFSVQALRRTMAILSLFAKLRIFLERFSRWPTVSSLV